MGRGCQPALSSFSFFMLTTVCIFHSGRREMFNQVPCTCFPSLFLCVFEKVWKMHKLDSDVWQIISGTPWEWRDFAVGLPDVLFSRTDRPWVLWFPISQAPGVQLKYLLEQHCPPLHGKKYYQIIRLCHEDVIKILRKLINAHVQ